MPVIRVEATTTMTLPPEARESLLTRLRNEFSQITERGPVIFEIPLGADCMDVLVVWNDSDWTKLSSEERSRLILDMYDQDKREQIAQASGVTYDEAMQQQLLPYVLVSAFEQNPQFALLASGNDRMKADRLLGDIRAAKRKYGGIVPPSNKDEVELRFPTRAICDGVRTQLTAAGADFHWQVLVDAEPST